MKILFIVDELPYPPRNGVTIPTFNYLSRLALMNEVYILYVVDKDHCINAEDIKVNKKFVKDIFVLYGEKEGKFFCVINEVFLDKPFFMKNKYNFEKIEYIFKKKTFDIIWISPFPISDIVNFFIDYYRDKPLFVAGVNDCTTSMFVNENRKLLFSNYKDIFSHYIKFLRSFFIAKIETKILSKYDLILVQTEKENEWFAKISSGSLSGKIEVVSNGVNEKLLSNPIQCDGKNILFLGDLRGWYQQTLSWILDNVWPQIKRDHPDSSFFVIGKNAPPCLQKRLKSDSGIEYHQYINDIKEAFANKTLMLAPIFKNYGLINKVVESMAAGVPVVGDSGSFNGIHGFRNGIHGIVANNAQEMIKAANSLLASSQKKDEIARVARALVKNQFSWEDRILQVNNRIEQIFRNRHNAVK